MTFPTHTPTGVQLPVHPKAIAFDLDGTLLDYEGNLNDNVIRAVKMITRSGIKVFIVTGRLRLGSERYWRALELDTPLANCNGAYIGFPGEAPFHHVRLSETVRRKIVDFDAAHNCYVNYSIDNAIYTLKDGATREYYIRVFSPVNLAAGPEDILARPCPTKCVFIPEESEQAALLAELKALIGDEAEITTSNSRFIEIMPPGINKGVGIELLAKWLGVGVEDFIAVGDAMNDLPMIEKAGFAISFKSGDPRMADHVDMLLPPLWEDGMDVLAECILGMRSSGRFLTPRSSRFYNVLKNY